MTTLNSSFLLQLEGPVNESALFLPGPELYSVALNETGLPEGALWGATIGSLGAVAPTSTLLITNVAVGTYTIQVPDVAGAPGTRYALADDEGLPLAVAGNTSVSVVFTVEFLVEVASTPGGITSAAPGWVSAGSLARFSAAPNSGEEFVEWTGTVASPAPTLNITVTGAINETAVFQVPPTTSTQSTPWYDDAAGVVIAAAVAFVLIAMWRRRAPPSGNPGPA